MPTERTERSRRCVLLIFSLFVLYTENNKFFFRSYADTSSSSRRHRSRSPHSRRDDSYHRHRYGREYERDSRRSGDYNELPRRGSPSHDKGRYDSREIRDNENTSDKALNNKASTKESNGASKPKVPISLEELLQKRESEKQVNERVSMIRICL